jgi:hypothetical protein
MWVINDAMKPHEHREYIAGEKKTRHDAWYERRNARKRGTPWPIHEMCQEGTHDECYGKVYIAALKMRYSCACVCHTPYPETKRTCWCSEARLREGGTRLWRIIPSAWIRWIHRRVGFPCTPRWQAEKEEYS